MCLPRTHGIGRRAFSIALLTTLLGCSIELPSDISLPGDDLGIDIPEDIVVVIFRNLAVVEAVDVEFYSTTDPVENLPDDLFAEENLISANIGVAGTGIVRPLTNDWIELPCTENLILGTAGGTFSDNDSGEVRGTGNTRWARAAALGLCGTVVTFVFAGDGETFSTTVRVGL